MAFKITQNFDLKNTQPLDARNQVTKAGMKAYNDTIIDDGHISFCPDDGKMYQYKYSNSADATLGKWRELVTAKEGDDCLCEPLTDAQIDGIFTDVSAPAAGGAVYELSSVTAEEVKTIFGV